LSTTKSFPRRLSFFKLCDILIAYLNAGADREYVGVSEVVGKSNVTLHNISRNNNFLKSWGFLEESDKEAGKYKLSQEAAEFAHAHRIDRNGALTKEMLRSLLSKDATLVGFVERAKRENLSKDTILIELPRVVGDLRADKVGLTAFLEMMNYAFQLEEAPTTLRPSRPSTPAKIARTPSKTKSMPKLEAPPHAVNISINLAISPEISPEKLKEYIKALLEAYNEHSEDTN